MKALLALVTLLCLAGLPVSNGSAAPSPQGKSHPDTCPKGCDPCTKAIEKGLANLASQQQGNGGFKGSMGQDVGVTVVAGLAFLAAGSTDKEGPYSKNVAQVRDYLIQKKAPYFTVFHTWNVAYSTIFLAELYSRSPSDSVKDALKKFVADMGPLRRDNGGWGHNKSNLLPGEPASKAQTYPMSLTVCTYITLAGLTYAKEAGVEVPNEYFEGAIKYFKSAAANGGAPKYTIDGGRNPETQELWAGRSASILAFLPKMPNNDSSLATSLSQYATKNFTVLSPKSRDAHSYTNVLLGSLGMYLQGPSAWKQTEKLRNEILGLQQGDGGWVHQIPLAARAYGSNTFLTGSYTFILSIPYGNLGVMGAKKGGASK